MSFSLLDLLADISESLILYDEVLEVHGNSVSVDDIIFSLPDLACICES